MPPDALADFQDALLNLLAEGLPVERIRERLRDDPAFAAFRDYVIAIEPRMLEVAVELVRKWGRRTP
jgi:hypothetical protein